LTASHLITDLLSSQLGPDWTVEGLAEQLLLAIAARRSEEGQVFGLNGDALTDRQSRRLVRPLLACLSALSRAESGTPDNICMGHLTFRRPGPEGPVLIDGEFKNEPGCVRLELKRSHSLTGVERYAMVPRKDAVPVPETVPIESTPGAADGANPNAPTNTDSGPSSLTHQENKGSSCLPPSASPADHH
jgi:hypothetical protein